MNGQSQSASVPYSGSQYTNAVPVPKTQSASESSVQGIGERLKMLGDSISALEKIANSLISQPVEKGLALIGKGGGGGFAEPADSVFRTLDDELRSLESSLALEVARLRNAVDQIRRFI